MWSTEGWDVKMERRFRGAEEEDEEEERSGEARRRRDEIGAFILLFVFVCMLPGLLMWFCVCVG